MKRTDDERFEERVRDWYGTGRRPHTIEAFEMSRYGRQLTEDELRGLFRLEVS